MAACWDSEAYDVEVVQTRENPPNPGHGYGFVTGNDISTLTRTRLTRTRDPYGFCQPAVIPIQGSATPSERAFSSGGITGCARRNRLQPAVFEALQLLKSAY